MGFEAKKADHSGTPRGPSALPESGCPAAVGPRGDSSERLGESSFPVNGRSASHAVTGRGGGLSPWAGNGGRQVAAGRSPLLGGPSCTAPGLNVRGGAEWRSLEKEPAPAAVARGSGAQGRRAEPGPRGGGTAAAKEARAGGRGWPGVGAKREGGVQGLRRRGGGE